MVEFDGIGCHSVSEPSATKSFTGKVKFRFGDTGRLVVAGVMLSLVLIAWTWSLGMLNSSAVKTSNPSHVAGVW